MKLKSPQLLRECAQILESMKQLQEAAQLYSRGGMSDKAASIYLKCSYTGFNFFLLL